MTHLKCCGLEVPFQRSVQRLRVDPSGNVDRLGQFLNRLNDIVSNVKRGVRAMTYTQRPLNSIDNVFHQTYGELMNRRSEINEEELIAWTQLDT